MPKDFDVAKNTDIDVDDASNGDSDPPVTTAPFVGKPQDIPERVTSQSDPRGLYHALGVTSESTNDEIRQAYKQVAKVCCTTCTVSRSTTFQIAL